MRRPQAPPVMPRWALLAWAILTLGGACHDLLGQAFPLDSSGHAYVEASAFGADSIAAAQMVEIFRTPPENRYSFACVYGDVVHDNDGLLALHVTRVERVSVLHTVGALDVPACREDAVGFLVFGAMNPQDAVLIERGLETVVRAMPHWVVGAAVVGIQPVPPAVADSLHIPAWIPRLLAVLYIQSGRPVHRT